MNDVDETFVPAPYADGRWWVIDHRPSSRFPLVCRGNTGEVYPNVVTPLTGSIVGVPFLRGQVRVSTEFGLATDEQLAEFDGANTAITAVLGGYLYGNVSLTRSAAARMPGFTVEDLDRQMWGLSDAPPHQRGAGERSVRATIRSVRSLARGVLRIDTDRLAADRRDTARYVARYVEGVLPIGTASNAELLAIPLGVAPWLERMMGNLMIAGIFTGMGRSMLEGALGSRGDDGLVNQLTAGLGTVESAEPAMALWDLSRLVGSDVELTGIFDGGLGGLEQRLAASGSPAAERFRDRFDAFRRIHGARGPDEWELESPTWGSDPAIGLAMIDRLRHAPDDRDPHRTNIRLASEREQIASRVRAELPWHRRRLFDLGRRAAMAYAPQREATKAAFVRVLDPTRRALAELARRSGIEHSDFFLLTIEQVPAALDDPSSVREVIAERRRRRDYLQARVPPFWFQGEIPSPTTWELRASRSRPDGAARQLHGIGVCAGQATGTARVVLDPTAPGELGPGDILVAPITDPAWTPLFLAAAGVVVDVGAQQSHAAIVARELGIPAVVSAEGASATIPDGALVTVNGSTGVVTVHQRDTDSSRW